VNLVTDPASVTPALIESTGLVATGRRVWSAMARLALVAGLAVALLVGALALGPSPEASAVSNCEQAWSAFDYFFDLQLRAIAFGHYGAARVFSNLADMAIAGC
jgi:hypothetical protein